jgi:hypothetical protein
MEPEIIGRPKCGFCATGHHDNCKKEIKYHDKIWVCECAHEVKEQDKVIE